MTLQLLSPCATDEKMNARMPYKCLQQHENHSLYLTLTPVYKLIIVPILWLWPIPTFQSLHISGHYPIIVKIKTTHLEIETEPQSVRY